MKKLILIILILFPALAFAHVTGGTIERVEGDYFIDIGYTDTILKANKSVHFDFGVYTNPNKAQVDYDSVYVKFVKDTQFVFTATLPKQSLGTAGMTYTFPDSGTYDVTLIYQTGQTKVVQTDFQLVVAPVDTAAKAKFSFENPAVSFAGGIILGMLAQFFASLAIRRGKAS